MRLSYLARAKINLCLDVLGSRPDGYHEIATVMQSVVLSDLLTFEPAPNLTLELSGEPVPKGEANLVLRAAQRLAQEAGYRGGAKITLVKKIPVAAGLGGGSADAAATLVGLNELWGLGCDLKFLLAVGAALGADVPFCLTGGTALATGKGEKVWPLPPLPELGVLILKPPYSVATAVVYRDFDLVATPQKPVAGAMAAALKRGAWREALAYCCNALEVVTLRKYPELGLLKEELKEAGALATLMSGSGPAIYGIFATVEAASQAARSFVGRGLRVIVTATASEGLVRQEQGNF